MAATAPPATGTGPSAPRRSAASWPGSRWSLRSSRRPAEPVTRPPVHHYSAEVSWAGSTGAGYETYGRDHRTRIGPSGIELELSSDPAFRGDPERLNPEQLLVSAAASCQLLSFLAVAARARIDVVGYTDRATGEMPEDRRPMCLTRIELRPHVVLVDGPDDDRLRHLTEVAHRECFIASSLRTEVVVEPTFERVAGPEPAAGATESGPGGDPRVRPAPRPAQA